MFKKLVAKKKLKNRCMFCCKEIFKGRVYYKERVVITDYGIIYAFNIYKCSRCNYKDNQHEERFKKFKEICTHPITDMVYEYIPGECVMQPEYDQCRLCGKRCY